MGIYVKFTKTTHQIWSCYVILASNSENFSFSPNSVLNFRKSYQIWGELAQEQKSYRQKQVGGGKHPPVLIGLKWGIGGVHHSAEKLDISCPLNALEMRSFVQLQM